MIRQNGFLLTRQWRDARDGLMLRYWLHTSQGPLLIEQKQQEGIFFVESDKVAQAKMLIGDRLHRLKALDLHSFKQKPVTGFYFSQQRYLRNAANLLKGQDIEPLEADVRTVDRYLMERFITASMSITSDEMMRHERFQYASNASLKSAEFTPDFKVVSFDIETAYPSNNILSIAVYTDDAQKVFMIGSAQDLNSDSVKNDIECDMLEDERSLLIQFMAWLQETDPDILIGWNCINFDLRVLDQACQRYGFKLSIGRNNENIEWRTSPNNEEHYFVLVPGRAVLDGIDTLKSASYHFESFSLEFVSQALLGKGKLIHDPDDRGDEILRLFNQDKTALAAYNLSDCELVWQIFELTRLIHFAIERSRLTGLPLDKIGGSVAAFENQYLPRLHRQGYVAPNLPVNPQGVGSPGGYVMNSQPGLYDHVLVLDFKSLYPSIIRTFMVDPYGLAEGDRLKVNASSDFVENYDRSVFSKGYRGAYFKKQASILPSLIEHLWLARDKAKQDNNASLSQAIKIIMNSYYGVMGTPGCRFFDPRLPSSITLRGHEIMLKTKELIEEEGYQVIYGDTDSIFVWLNLKNNSSDIDLIGQSLANKVNLWWTGYLKEEYQLESALELEYENHYTRFLMPTIRGSSEGTKKRYAGMVCKAGFNAEEPKAGSYSLVFKGLETVRTDWTLLARELQKELYDRIFLNKEYKTYICQLVEDLKAGKYDDKLVYRKRLRRRLNEYQKNIPPHVQAAKKAEIWLLENGKRTRYQQGGWIEYCYTINGPEPLENLASPLDYEVYIERQIAPVVDGIVMFLGTSYDDITSSQMNLI
jgi:DNA polymerase-2